MSMDYKEINRLLQHLSGLSRGSSFYSDNKLLLPLLQHKKSRIRWCVADHFGKVRYQKAVQELVDALDDPCWRVRLHSAKALGRIRDHSSIDALISHRKDECSYVRRRVVSALGQFDQNHNIIPYLIDALVWDEDHEVKERASEALLHFERTGAMIAFMENLNHLYDEFDFLRDVYAAFQDSGTIPQQQWMDILIAHREDKCPFVRMRIVSSFGDFNQSRDIIFPYLIDTLLWDEDRRVRSEAFAALSGFKRSGLVVLIAFMENPEHLNSDPDFQRYVYAAFQNVGTISKHQLIRFLSTSNDVIRNQAIQTFLKAPSKEIQQAVKTILNNPAERENLARNGLQKMEIITRESIDTKPAGNGLVFKWTTRFNYTTYFRYPVYFTTAVDFASKIYLDEATPEIKNPTSNFDSLKQTKRLLARQDPRLAINEIRNFLIIGLFGLGLVVLMVISGGITNLFSKITKIDDFSALVEFLLIFFMFLFMMGFSILAGILGISSLLRRRIWLREASHTQGMVIDKKFIYSEDQYGKVRGNYHQLILKLTEVGGIEKTIKVRVREHVYKKFASGDSVRVYYSNTNPLEILVEGE